MMDWLDIDPQLFHFLRPEWLWLFLPMVIVLVISILSNRSKARWQTMIAPHLRPYMIRSGSRLAIVGPLILFILGTSLMILAAAGPTWRKVEVPGARSEAILMVALDLSLSMMVEDVSPNRLERAKFKIRDLLQANPGAKVGLMVYSGTAHIVVSPSNDYKLITYQLESLAPGVMPVQGTQLDRALDLADTLLGRTEAPGTLLLVTDNLDEDEAVALTDFVDKTSSRVELITLATPQGGRIPRDGRGNFFKENGEFVISKLNQSVLFQLQNRPGINVNPLTLDKTDIEKIADDVRSNLTFRGASEESDEDWEEMGYVLLFLVAIVYAFWFRKGWMVQWSLLLLMLTSCSGAKSWDDWWFTPDYQGQRAADQGDYQSAAAQFETLANKGAAYFHAGDYESAINIFNQDSSAAGLYNLGLAYAANGQNEQAREILLLAEAANPKDERIRQSLEQNEMVIQQIDSMRQLNADSAITINEPENKGELEERRAKSKDEELSSDTEVEELPEDGKRVTDEVATEMRIGEEMESPPEDFQPKAGDDNAQNVMMREISADPSEFLRRRFKYQYERYFSDQPKPTKPW